MTEVKRGSIYLANLDPVTGSEQGGIRPVIVLQNDIGNRYSPTVIIAAITAQDKKNMPTHITVSAQCLPQRSTVLLEQLRTIDKSRLIEYMGDLSNCEMKRIQDALCVSMDIRGR